MAYFFYDTWHKELECRLLLQCIRVRAKDQGKDCIFLKQIPSFRGKKYGFGQLMMNYLILLHPNPSQFQQRKMTRPEEEATRGDIIHISLSGGGISPGMKAYDQNRMLTSSFQTALDEPVVYTKVEGIRMKVRTHM